jgi:hypothetical protein
LKTIFSLHFNLHFNEAPVKILPIATIAVLLMTSSGMWAQSDAQKGLEKLKSLVGTWQGKTAKGEPVEDSFALTAGGTAVMGDDKMGSEEMLSLFYVDGRRLLMTHFCPSGNQPRMEATVSPDLKTISFDFLDATNLPSKQAGHMHHAIYIFSDSDHYSQEWTWLEDGKTTLFRSEMQRKK